jgi:hypothetical protein
MVKVETKKRKGQKRQKRPDLLLFLPFLPFLLPFAFERNCVFTLLAFQAKVGAEETNRA